MIIWAVVTTLLLVGNAIYCTVRIMQDFRGPRPANGVWGLFALAGVLSALAMAVLGAGLAMSGV